MKCASEKIVPKLLNFKRKQCRRNIAQEMLMTLNDDPDLLEKVITDDESWVYSYELNHPNGSVQKSQERKKHVKFGQM